MATLVVSAATGLACGGDGSDGLDGRAATSTVSDSAGVTIVTSTAPAGDPAAWGLSEEPLFSIGMLDGPAEYQLFDARDAVWLADGRVVIADGGSKELRFYDAEGTFLRAFGGEGEGPGEFTTISAVEPVGTDSVMAWDLRSRRLSVFSAETGFARSVALDLGGTFPNFLDRLSDGSLLVQIPSVVEEHEIVDGAVTERRRTYARLSPEGELLDTLGVFRGSRSKLTFLDGGGLAVDRVPFEPGTQVAAADSGFYEGDGERYELRLYGPSGTLRRVLRRPHVPIPVTVDLLIARFEETYASFRDRDPDYYATMRAAYETMPMEHDIAAFDRLLADGRGALWARDHPLPGDEVHRWSVFSADGGWAGAVEVPATFEVYDVRDDRVLGRVRDELDVERIVAFEVIRP